MLHPGIPWLAKGYNKVASCSATGIYSREKIDVEDSFILCPEVDFSSSDEEATEDVQNWSRASRAKSAGLSRSRNILTSARPKSAKEKTHHRSHGGSSQPPTANSIRLANARRRIKSAASRTSNFSTRTFNTSYSQADCYQSHERKRERMYYIRPPPHPDLHFMDRHARCHDNNHIHEPLLAFRPRKICGRCGDENPSNLCCNFRPTSAAVLAGFPTDKTFTEYQRKRPQTAPLARRDFSGVPKHNNVVRGTRPHFCNFVSSVSLHDRVSQTQFVPEPDHETVVEYYVEAPPPVKTPEPKKRIIEKQVLPMTSDTSSQARAQYSQYLAEDVDTIVTTQSHLSAQQQRELVTFEDETEFGWQFLQATLLADSDHALNIEKIRYKFDPSGSECLKEGRPLRKEFVTGKLNGSEESTLDMLLKDPYMEVKIEPRTVLKTDRPPSKEKATGQLSGSEEVLLNMLVSDPCHEAKMEPKTVSIRDTSPVHYGTRDFSTSYSSRKQYGKEHCTHPLVDHSGWESEFWLPRKTLLTPESANYLRSPAEDVTVDGGVRGRNRISTSIVEELKNDIYQRCLDRHLDEPTAFKDEWPNMPIPKPETCMVDLESCMHIVRNGKGKGRLTEQSQLTDSFSRSGQQNKTHKAAWGSAGHEFPLGSHTQSDLPRSYGLTIKQAMITCSATRSRWSPESPNNVGGVQVSSGHPVMNKEGLDKVSTVYMQKMASAYLRNLPMGINRLKLVKVERVPPKSPSPPRPPRKVPEKKPEPVAPKPAEVVTAPVQQRAPSPVAPVFIPLAVDQSPGTWAEPEPPPERPSSPTRAASPCLSVRSISPVPRPPSPTLQRPPRQSPPPRPPSPRPPSPRPPSPRPPSPRQPSPPPSPPPPPPKPVEPSPPQVPQTEPKKEEKKKKQTSKSRRNCAAKKEKAMPNKALPKAPPTPPPEPTVEPETPTQPVEVVLPPAPDVVEVEKEPPKVEPPVSAVPSTKSMFVMDSQEILELEMKARRREVEALMQEEKPPEPIIIDTKRKTQPWLHGRLALSKRSSRFELPMDMRLLETLDPKDYLRKYCIVSSRRHMLYQKYFMKNKDRCGKLLYKDLEKAIKDVLTSTIDQPKLELLFDYCGVTADTQVDYRLYCGISAFAERLLYGKFVTEDTADLGDYQKDKIECADFSALDWKFHGVKVNKAMQKLLRIL